MPFASNSAVATVVIPEELLGGTDCKQVRIGWKQHIDFTDNLAGRAECKNQCRLAKLGKGRNGTAGCNRRCNSLR